MLDLEHVIIHKNDNVLVTLRGFRKGEKIQLGSQEVELREDIPIGHKLAIKIIEKAEEMKDSLLQILRTESGVNEWRD
jgi:hypothetical protein